MSKFKNKYRIESNRMPGWDYSSDGWYFITPVVQNRECILGLIKNNKMILSDFGKIVETEFLKSFEIRNELFLNEYQIMPNHFHAIVIINNNKNNDIENLNEPIGDSVETNDVETNLRSSLRRSFIPSFKKQFNEPIFQRKPKSISSFIAGFKSAVNTKIDDYIDMNNLDIPKYNKQNHFFQPNYHDHIIRNEKEYYRIKNYIKNNPKNWNADKFND